MTDAGPRGSIALRRIAGRVHGQPVRGDGRVELRGEQVSIPDLRLVWGDAALAAAGVVGDTLDLRFRLDAPDLASSCRTSPARSRSTARSTVRARRRAWRRSSRRCR